MRPYVICHMLSSIDGRIDGDHLICYVSERVPEDYLHKPRKKGISYVVRGKTSVDLSKALKLLGEHFGVKTVLLEGGGHINGAFLKARLVDEVSLLGFDTGSLGTYN